MMTGAGSYLGTMNVGDLDVWSFTACTGDALVLQMTKLTNSSSLTPWIRLYGRDGTLLNSVANASSALISRTAPASGNYLVVLADDSSGYGGSGAYTFTVNGLSSGLKLCPLVISCTNADVGGVGGTPGAGFVLFTTTNITTPAHLWTPIQTNLFDQFGVFSYTNLFNPAERQRYFLLQRQ